MLRVTGRKIGRGQPTYVIAEGGVNHSGDLDTAFSMLREAALAGADAFKLQKRSPEHCVPRAEWDRLRDTPWGTMRYIDYRHRVEFNEEQYSQLAAAAAVMGIDFFVSVWDLPSLEFALKMDMPAIKIPSAKNNDWELLDKSVRSGRPVIVSTGMSSMDDVKDIVRACEANGRPQLALLHCNSSYPASVDELDLRVIDTWLHTAALMDYTIGYSNHHPSIIPPVNAVALGAQIIEAHITLDRSSWGTDQASSIEPTGFARMVKYIRATELSLGNGTKRMYDSERAARRKLRGKETT